LVDAIGLERDPKVELLIDRCENLLDFGQVLECLEKAMQDLDLQDFDAGTSECSVVKDEVIDETCEELCSFRAVPKRWDNMMKRNEKLGKFRQALSRWCQGYRPLIVEICCEEDSQMKNECKRLSLSLPYIGISESVDIRDPNVCLLLRHMLDFRGPIVFWVSSPCTAGCRLRQIGFPQNLEKWQERFKVHRVIWRALDTIFRDKLSRKALWIFQEWPWYCDLFLDKYYLAVARRLGLTYESEVCRCCLDGVKKVWKIMSNSQKGSELMKVPRDQCQCQVRREVPLNLSGVYSKEVAGWFIKVIKAAVKAFEEEDN